MMCAESRPGGDPCRRVAVAAVSGGDVVALLCGDCALRAVDRVPELTVRFFADRSRAPGRPA